MANRNFFEVDQSINAGRDVIGSATGSVNMINVEVRQASMPQPNSVNIQAELSKV